MDGYSGCDMDFNPRSREGSDRYRSDSCIQIQLISIHAPARGATCTVRLFDFLVMNFNPRSREGSDVTIDFNCSASNGISIHAPARGATLYRCGDTGCHEFQSTLPRGERRRLAHLIVGSLFISIHAPARGATAAALFFVQKVTDFNPRSREGSDSKTA